MTDKAIQGEYSPVYGWTRVQTTSKYEGQALARSISWLRTCPTNAAYVTYKGKKVACNPAYAAMYPKQAASLRIIERQAQPISRY